MNIFLSAVSGQFKECRDALDQRPPCGRNRSVKRQGINLALNIIVGNDKRRGEPICGAACCVGRQP